MRRRERGAVAIEAAMITGLLILIALGAFEFGMAFRSSFGLAASSREATRVGASLGPVVDADCRILESAAAALAASTDNEIISVKVFEHIPGPGGGTEGDSNTYFPFDPDVDDPTGKILRCSDGWWTNGTFYNWDETTRDNEGEDRDWLGVEVEYRHFWITGFAWWNGSAEWSNRTIMEIEPVNYSG